VTILPGAEQMIHATCVAVDGKGLLITGPSGSGKSGLALSLMALGARLVADDRTLLSMQGDHLYATCPETLSGMIEARGLGILRADPVPGAPVALVVDMGQTESDRLPPHRTAIYLQRTVPLVHSQQNAHFPAALLHYLCAGRIG
jgi:HPr kinase/phosphorylase